MAISIRTVHGLLDYLSRRGISSAEFCAAAAFDASRLEDLDSRVTHLELDALFELALDKTADPSLGLRLGEHASPASYTVAANLVLHAKSLRQAIDDLTRYHRLVDDEASWTIEETGDVARLELAMYAGSERCMKLRAEMAMAGFYRVVRFFTRSILPRYVAFEHPAPADCSRYVRVFDSLARFEQPFTAIVFDRALLDALTGSGDEIFHEQVVRLAEQQVSRLERNLTYADRVRDVLEGLEATPRADMNTVARALGLSSRSLRRRLSEEGASFADIAASALAAQAKRMLSDESRSIQETAYTMGFAEPSAFHRAFKRWTGTTPTAFREEQGGARRSSRPPPSG